MNNIWDLLKIGKIYYFDMEYDREGSRRTELIEGIVKEKLTDSFGNRFIALENNTTLHLDNIVRSIGPF
jgi:hypothetical protein